MLYHIRRAVNSSAVNFTKENKITLTGSAISSYFTSSFANLLYNNDVDLIMQSKNDKKKIATVLYSVPTKENSITQKQMKFYVFPSSKRQ